MVELGLKTIDDFRPRDRVLGERITEFRLIAPELKGKFADGLIDTEIKSKEFDEMIYTPPRTESMGEDEQEEIANSKAKAKSEPEDEDVDDLFA